MSISGLRYRSHLSQQGGQNAYLRIIGLRMRRLKWPLIVTGRLIVNGLFRGLWRLRIRGGSWMRHCTLGCR